MKIHWLIVLVASTLTTGALCGQTSAQSTPPQTQSLVPAHLTPAAPIEDLVFCFNRNELLQSTRLFTEGEGKPIQAGAMRTLEEFALSKQSSEALAEMVAEIQNTKGGVMLVIGKPTFQVQANEAIATFQLSLQNRLFNSVTQTETLKLRQDPEPEFELEGVLPKWRIVPGDPNTILSDGKSGYLLRLATYLAYSKVMLGKIRAARSADNMRQLTRGVTFYFNNDGEEELVLRSDNWKQAVRPDLDSEQVFQSRNYGSSVSAYSDYSFNTNLEGLTQVKLMQIRNREIAVAGGDKPSDIVLIYEGANGALHFNHDGRAAVGFADLHVELVDAKRAESLLWWP